MKTLVRRNKDLTSKDVIAEKLQEFESRIQTGIHYKIPYPRPVNVAPGAIGKNPQVVTPVYLHSYGHASARSGASQKRANTSPVYED